MQMYFHDNLLTGKMKRLGVNDKFFVLTEEHKNGFHVS